MGFMEKAAAKIATKYGTVTRGRHNGCKIALGNPPDKKVTTSHSFSQIIFVEGSEEKGRYDIIEDLVGMSILSQDDRCFQFLLMFKDEQTCEFNLDIRQEDKPVAGLLKSFLGQKNTVNATAEEKLELQYRGVKVFVQNAGIRMMPKDLRMFKAYFDNLGILDSLTSDILDILLENAPADEEE